MRKFSIIIPSCSQKHLILCLSSIIKTTDFRIYDTEVIVVLNGAGKETVEYIDSLGPHFSSIYFENKIGVCSAMNAGAKAATGKYIIKIDDDCEILPWGNESQWLERLHHPFKISRLIGQTGTAINHHTEYKKPYQSIPGFLSMTTKNIWEELNGFDEEYNPGFGEDTDFSFRVQNLGYKIVSVVENPIFMNQMYINTSYPLWHKSISNYSSDLQTLIAKNNQILKRKFS